MFANINRLLIQFITNYLVFFSFSLYRLVYFEFQSVRRPSFVQKIHIILILKLHLIGFVHVFIRTRLSHLFFSISPLTCAQCCLFSTFFASSLLIVFLFWLFIFRLCELGRTDKQFCLAKSLCVLSKHFFPNHSVGWKTCACYTCESIRCVAVRLPANSLSFGIL